jgi:hypothetical protein
MKMIKVEDFNLSEDYDNGHKSNELVIALRIDDETAEQIKDACYDGTPLLSKDAVMIRSDISESEQKERILRSLNAYIEVFGLPYDNIKEDTKKMLVNWMNDTLNGSWTSLADTAKKEQAEIDKNAWKVRLKEEYAQLKERYDKLRKANAKNYVDARTATEKTPYEEGKKQDLRADLMRGQEIIMRDYLEVLERRLVLEGIEIN